jgi:hypothetical protein
VVDTLVLVVDPVELPQAVNAIGNRSANVTAEKAGRRFVLPHQ